MLGGAVHGGDRPAAQQVERRQEVVRTASVLQARDELQQDAVDAVAEARLGPVGVQRVLQSINRSVVFNSDNDAHNKHTHDTKGKGSPYSITERRVPELIPVVGSQPAGDVSHKTGGRLPLLSARPAVTPATLKRAATSFAALRRP